MFDYRALEARAKVLQDKVQELTSKEMNLSEHDEYIGLMAEIHSLEDTAGQMKDAKADLVALSLLPDTPDSLRQRAQAVATLLGLQTA